MPQQAPKIAPIRRKKPRDNLRGSACKRGYDRKWRYVRSHQLKLQPCCEDCLTADRVTIATEVHHIQKIVDRPDLRLHLGNLMSLCRDCHAIRTARGE